jgi:hypothetical protein
MKIRIPIDAAIALETALERWAIQWENHEEVYDDIERIAKNWFKKLDTVVLEIDTYENTCTVIPAQEQ